MATQRWALVPRHGLFFKDGRGWFTSDSGRGHALAWPFPSSVLGALRTAYGRSVESSIGRPWTSDEWQKHTSSIVMGPMIALRRFGRESWEPSHRMWPVPADAWYGEGARNVKPLVPHEPLAKTLGRHDEPARELLWRPEIPREKPDTAPAFWTEEEFAQWISCKSVPTLSRDERELRHLPGRIDVHVSIDSTTRSALDGALFAHEVKETLQVTDDGIFEWALAMKSDMPEARTLDAPWTLGSDKRIAYPEPIDDSMFQLSTEATFRDAPGLRLFVVTPAHFTAGWVPDGFVSNGQEYLGKLPGIDDELVLRAAFVPRAMHVSGWDMVNRRPKPTRQLVPGGSVYFFQKVDGSIFGAHEIESLWLQSIGQDMQEGFGRVVAGPWEIKDQ